MTRQRNGTFARLDPETFGFSLIQETQDFEVGLKYGADLVGTSPELQARFNLEDFDVLTPIESCHLIVRVPRKDFVPQYIAVFHCFSPVLWMFVLGTLILFTLIHSFSAKVEGEYFPTLYPESERSSFSTFLSIIRYILGIGQPRIVLIKLWSGKMLFFIFVFSMLILTTLFQSGMVTLLSVRIRYAEIDSLKDLEESDLMVESWNPEADVQVLSSDPQFNWIKEKLTCGIESRCQDLDCDFLLSVDFLNSSSSLIDTNETRSHLSGNDKFLAEREIAEIFRTRAYLARVSAEFAKYNNMIFYDVSAGREYESHDVAESIMSYPILYLTVKHSIYLRDINDIVSRFLEAGVIYSRAGMVTSKEDVFIADSKDILRDNFLATVNKGSGEKPRPFSLTDLKLAFILLSAGLTISVGCFIIELMRNV